MPVANMPAFVDDHESGQPAKFEQFNLLAVQVCHPVVRVWQADEGQLFSLPVPGKRRPAFWPNNHNFSIVTDKSQIILPQLRHMPAAVRSGKAAIKHQNNVFSSPKIRQANRETVQVC